MPQVPTPAKRRVAQLGMLAFAVVIVMGAYANVGLGDRRPDPLGHADATASASAG